MDNARRSSEHHFGTTFKNLARSAHAYLFREKRPVPETLALFSPDQRFITREDLHWQVTPKTSVSRTDSTILQLLALRQNDHNYHLLKSSSVSKVERTGAVGEQFIPHNVTAPLSQLIRVWANVKDTEESAGAQEIAIAAGNLELIINTSRDFLTQQVEQGAITHQLAIVAEIMARELRSGDARNFSLIFENVGLSRHASAHSTLLSFEPAALASFENGTPTEQQNPKRCQDLVAAVYHLKDGRKIFTDQDISSIIDQKGKIDYLNPFEASQLIGSQLTQSGHVRDACGVTCQILFKAGLDFVETHTALKR